MNRVTGAPVFSEWNGERESRRRRERALPPGLRADVRGLRRDDLAQGVLDLIDERVQLEARRFQRAENTVAKIQVTPILTRKLLKVLDRNQEFRGFIRNTINSLLRTNHLTKTDPQAVASLPEVLRPTPQPTRGVLTLRSSIGLGTATYLEAEPEEWCHYVVNAALARMQPELDADITLDNDMLRIFVIGAGPGGIARAVTALESPVRIEVVEQDYVLKEPNAMPCVSGPRGPSGEEHDVIVMVLPCPGEGGAANHRRLYRNERAREFDLSALGPRKWRAHVEGWISALPDLMTAGGEAFILAPAGVRYETGYLRDESLLESVIRAVNAAGLKVVEQMQIVEVEPVNQPFVGRARPERWSLRLRRPTPGAVAEVDDA